MDGISLGSCQPDHGVISSGVAEGSDYSFRQSARGAIFEYIETYYNRKRKHSAIGYKIPMLFENKYFKPHFANFRKYRGTEFLDKKVWVNRSLVLDGQCFG